LLRHKETDPRKSEFKLAFLCQTKGNNQSNSEERMHDRYQSRQEVSALDG